MINWPIASVRPLEADAAVVTEVAMAVDIARANGLSPQRALLGPVKWAQLAEKMNADMEQALMLLGAPLVMIAAAQAQKSFGCEICGVWCEEGKLPGIVVL